MKLILIILVSLTCSQMFFQKANAAPLVSINYRFTDAATHIKNDGHSEATLPQSADGQIGFSDEKMSKTLQVIDLANLITSHLSEYAAARCEGAAPRICPYPQSDPTFANDTSDVQTNICQQRVEIADSLNRGLQRYIAKLASFDNDTEIDSAIDLVKHLADNIKTHAKIIKRPCFSEDSPLSPMSGPHMPTATIESSVASTNLHVTAGGAQNYSFFKKIVNDGDVPSDLVVEGFLSEFDLSLQGEPCDRLICVFPELAVDGQRLFVQVGMATRKNAVDFHRKPLNLSIVLDISGSMGATDGTRQTRLEWAKDALKSTLSQLHSDDLLSIVVFETTSSILLKPTAVNNQVAILKKIQNLQPLGSTNLEAGLRDGYDLVSANLSATYENRVILISDAGLNTGVTDPSELLRLVTDHASDDIGLTAIGMGSNFQEDFIHTITRSKGGNYLFAQSGSDLSDYFDSFDYLVTPIAYAFSANLALDGIKGRLVKTYGIPQSEGAKVDEIFDVQTLFYSKAGGGGAIVLEYQMQDPASYSIVR